MIAFLQRIRNIFAPFEVSLLEAFLLRAGLAYAVWTLFPLQAYPGEPYPNGLARLLPGDNFTWLNNPANIEICRWFMAGALLLYVAHRFAFLAYPIICFLLIASGTLANSQSEDVTHHSQVITMVMLAQAIWYFADLWQRRGKCRDHEQSLRWHQLAFYFSIQFFMAGYMVSVVSKMTYSDGEWITRSAYVPVQLEKNILMDHYNVAHLPDAMKAKGGEQNWFDKLDIPRKTQEIFIAQPNVARLALTTGMLLEAFCFFALAGRRVALVYGLFLIFFHLIISWTMNLTFKYHLALLALYFVGVPYWITRLLPANKRNPALLEP
ncbi:MAG: hypothetical protein ACKO2G_15590 [Verrucomicrobiales bacterium]